MKLDGLRVVDLSLFLPGPHLTTMLADHGAEVFKIEPPGDGEPTRHIGYRSGDASVWFRNTHRGKKSIVLDLKNPEDHARLLDLADTCDVMIEAFRPGVVQRLGVDYATIAKRNPGIVYASIAGFGQTGPERLRPAHDLGIEALSGIVSLNLGQDGQPAQPHMPVADINGSMMALAGILMALYRRQKTGAGDYIDISMQDATVSWLPNAVGAVFAEDRAPVVQQERSWGGHSFYNIYPTKDQKHVVLSGVEPKFIRTLLTDLNRPDLISTAMQPPGPDQETVKVFLRKTFLEKTRDEWDTWMVGRDICYAPVLDLHEALHQPQLVERDMIFRDAEGHLHIGNPIKFMHEPAQINTDIPAMGQHNDLVGKSTEQPTS